MNIEITESLDLFDRAVRAASKADSQGLISWPAVGAAIRSQLSELLKKAAGRRKQRQPSNQGKPNLILIGHEPHKLEAVQIEYPDGTLSQLYQFHLSYGRRPVGDIVLFFSDSERVGQWYTAKQVAAAFNEQSYWKVSQRLVTLEERIPVFEKWSNDEGRIAYRLEVNQVRWQCPT